jgi:hypothetical protein
MNHAEAEESQAVERYTLDEMRQEERDAFEEHYFDCRVCSSGVRDGARMMAAGRRVVRETAATATNVVPMPPRWKAWIPAAAAAMLLMVNGGLLFVQRGAPVMAVSSEVIRGGSRGPGEPVPTIPAGKRAGLLIEIVGDSPRYEITILKPPAHVVQTHYVSAEKTKDEFVLPLDSLPAGGYEVVIKGVTDGNRTEIIGKSPLQVQ